MNIALALAGSLGSMLVIIFAIVAIVDGFRVALAVITAVVAFVALTGGLIAFWVWLAGGFA